MGHSLKPLLPKLLLITPLVALQPLNAQSVNNPYATYYTVLNNPLYFSNHPNFSLLFTAPLLNSSQSVPLTEIEIKPVIKQPVIPLADAQFNQWGEAGLILRGRYPEKILPPSPEFSMVFPLFQEVDRLLLTQLSARHNHLHGEQTVYSLGFGQRFWPLNQHHWWGTHLFYELCPQGKHHRLGLVGEWQNSHARCTVNGYFPLSQWRLEEQNQLEKRPARSLDFRLQGFLSQKPCVNLNVLIEHAFSHSLTYPNQSAAAAAVPSPHPTALTLGLSYTPVSLVTISYDAKMAHKEKPAHQLQIQFTYRLGIPLAQQFNPVLATTGYNPATNRLSLIHRQSTMLLEQREISPPAAPPVPPTSAEETEQKPSESTPQAKHHAEDPVAPEEEVGTVQQKPANNFDQQKSNDTAANPDHQRASLSGNPPKPIIYPTLSPPQALQGSKPSSEENPHSRISLPLRNSGGSSMEVSTANIPPKRVSWAGAGSGSQQSNNPLPQTVTRERQTALPDNNNLLDNTLGAGKALDATTQSGIRLHSQTTEDNWDRGPSQDRDSRTSSSASRSPSEGSHQKDSPGNGSLPASPTVTPVLSRNSQNDLLKEHSSFQTIPSLVRQPSDLETVRFSQETNASWTNLGTQEIDQRLNSDNPEEDYLEKNPTSGTSTPNNSLSASSPKSNDERFLLEDNNRPMRARNPPKRLSYSAGPTGRKTQTARAGKKGSNPSKMNNQRPQDSDLLTTQTSLGDEEPTEQQQKSTALVHGLPGSLNTSSLIGPNLLHNNQRFSLFDDSENKSPSTQTPEFGGGQPDPSTVQPIRRTARPQKPRNPYTPPSDGRSHNRKQSR
ncbi:MAG: inverse autotransporter beta domain-containing protein [Candidatus Symbiodolus clandestinus]